MCNSVEPPLMEPLPVLRRFVRVQWAGGLLEQERSRDKPSPSQPFLVTQSMEAGAAAPLHYKGGFADLSIPFHPPHPPSILSSLSTYHKLPKQSISAMSTTASNTEIPSATDVSYKAQEVTGQTVESAQVRFS